MPNRDDSHFDLIVIGGGASGSHVAEGAADAGLDVALVEQDQLGGTCLNYGCDPVNLMIQAGQVLRTADTAGEFGVNAGDPVLDWSLLRERIDDLIGTIRDGDGSASLRGQGITFLKGHAEFLSENELVVDGMVMTADRFLIATGGHVAVPEIDGLEGAGYLTHRDIFTIDDLPASLVILGGGSHAVEFAQTFLTFGVEVTLITDSPRLLPREDEETVEALTDVLLDEGLVVLTESAVQTAMRLVDGSVRLSVEGPDGALETFEVDEILVATERVPLVDGLGLESAGVVTSAKGVRVGSGMRTSVPHIWATGDVTGIYAFTHVATYQAKIALHNILNPNAPMRADYRVVPWKVFTRPELARVGLTEAEARAGDWDVVTSRMDARNLPRPMTLSLREGFVKLVVDRKTHQVLGGHVLGAYASEVVAQIALVMQHRLPVSAIAETLHTHPSMSEAVYWAARNLMSGELSGS